MLLEFTVFVEEIGNGPVSLVAHMVKNGLTACRHEAKDKEISSRSVMKVYSAIEGIQWNNKVLIVEGNLSIGKTMCGFIIEGLISMFQHKDCRLFSITYILEALQAPWSTKLIYKCFFQNC